MSSYTRKSAYTPAPTPKPTSVPAPAPTPTSKPIIPIRNLIPVDNLNMCIVGCVSAGKSTILNAMFCQDLSQSKIKRTTMMPTVFVETKTPSICQTQEQISLAITEKNAEIIASTEHNQALNLASHGNQLVFDVDKLDIAISEKFNVTIFDMPGLNDARTKEQYYSYLRTNFHIFNIIIFVVNIESGLNTSDEMEILELIAEHIEKNKKSDKNIRMLTIANKADEMQLNHKTGYPEIVSDELKEMYVQIERTIEQAFRKRKITDNLIGIVPICGIDAHLFRMINSLGNKYELTPTQIQRIGISEMGNRFRSKTVDEQKAIVSKVLADNKFITDMIKLSGFERINQMLESFIKSQSDSMVSQNIFHEIANIPKWNIAVKTSLIPILTIYHKLTKVNMDEYSRLMKKLVSQINDKILSLITPETNIKSIINCYTDVTNYIHTNVSIISNSRSSVVGIKDILTPFWDFNKFPQYLIQKVLGIIKTRFNDAIELDMFKYYFDVIDNLGFLTKDTIEELLNIIIKNSLAVNTFKFFADDSVVENSIINVFNKIKIADNFMQFLSFFIRNQIESSTPAQIIAKLFLYRQCDTMHIIPIQEYIRAKIAKDIDIVEQGNTFDIGYMIEFDDYIFYIYYINSKVTADKSIISRLMSNVKTLQ